jgi:hypothetical protein
MQEGLGGLNLNSTGVCLGLGIQQHRKEEPRGRGLYLYEISGRKEKIAQAACTESVLYL